MMYSRPEYGKAPWNVMLEQVVCGLNGDRAKGLAEALGLLDVLVNLRGDDYRLFAPKPLVLERLHILEQVMLGGQVSLFPTGNLNERIGSDYYPRLLSRVPSPHLDFLLSPDPEHPIRLADTVRRLDLLLAQSRPSTDLIDRLPDELFVLIGHFVLSGGNARGSDGSVFHPDDHRVALVAVCHRWRAIFSEGQFWASLSIGDEYWRFDEVKGPAMFRAVERAGARLHSFVTKGGLTTVDTNEIPTTREIETVLEVLKGTLPTLKLWQFRLPSEWTLDRFWDVWPTGACNLERLSIQDREDHIRSNKFSMFFPSRLDFSSLKKLDLSSARLDMHHVQAIVPHLQDLRLANCSFVNLGGTTQNPVVFLFSDLTVLHFEYSDLEDFQVSVATFDLPRLEELFVDHLDDGDVEVILRAPPHLPCQGLRSLDISLNVPNLLAVLERQPTLVELSCWLSDPDAFIRAIGEGLCPALRTLEIKGSFGRRVSGQAILAMIKSRIEAEARGEGKTRLWEFGCWEMTLTREQCDWLWAHLRVLKSGDARPEHIPVPF